MDETKLGLRLVERMDKEANGEQEGRELWSYSSWVRHPERPGQHRYYALTLSTTLSHWVFGPEWCMDPKQTWVVGFSLGPWHLTLHRENVKAIKRREVS